MPCGDKGFDAPWPCFPLPVSPHVPPPQRRIHCRAVCRHAPFGAAPCAAKAALAARAKASGGGFTFTTIITPQGACQLLCSVVIKTSTLKIQGGFPSVSALLRVGRSLIHGSVLQPSHDRWVGWSETQDAVTHEIVPAAQGCHSPSQHPKLCPGCCSIPRGGDVPLAAACQAQKLHHDLMALHEGLMKQMKGVQGSPLHSNSKEWEAITGDSCPLRELKQSSPV